MSKVDTILDTLEITSDFSFQQTREKQYYKAIRKDYTLTKLKTLIDATECAHTKKKYWKTYHCQNVLLQNGTQFIGSLCRKRWCAECSRIKTAEMVNGYKVPLQELGKLYFVTLTRPNVKGRQLKSEISKMIKGFQRIKDNLRKNYKIKLHGIRKIEVTYNETENTYHPHFHFIQSDYSSAIILRDLWLEQFNNANIKGQDIRPIDATNETNLIELFKYATKDVTKDGISYTGKVLHTIYSALESKRIYQTYGELKKIKEPKEMENMKAEFNWIEPKMEVWEYNQNEKDWIDTNNKALINTYEFEKQLNLNYAKGKARASICRESKEDYVNASSVKGRKETNR